MVRFRYGQVGLRDLPADEYIKRNDPVAAALSVLMKPGEGLRGRARWAKLGELKVKAIVKVHESGLTVGDKAFLMSMVETYLPNEALPVQIRGEVMEALADVELMWHERIEQQGVEKGKKEVILHLLQRKFGRLPDKIIQKVLAITSPDVLDQIVDQAVMADSLAEIKLLA